VTTGRREDLERIRIALVRAAETVARFTPSTVGVREKENGSPVTEADLAADVVLRAALPAPGEGWLSEETPDDPARLACRRVWVVDPIDGTREFLAGSTEWCIAVGLVEDGVAVAGGICCPSAGELYLGAPGLGATCDGAPIRASARVGLEGATAIVGRWPPTRQRRRILQASPFTLRPCGAAAYQLALVAAGRGDAVWSRTGKAEWDVCAGVALVDAAGGHVGTWDGGAVPFNTPAARVPSLIACGPALADPLRGWLRDAFGPAA
jgi:myo-inositol-1(or 4)-monophosphatase